jgi:hypothetical protein
MSSDVSMILETLDVKKNDVFIYSLNKFDLSKNFKLINKDAQVKIPKTIHFNDVCRFFADGRPKNIIVYRLLTNLPHLDPRMVKYGYMVNIDGAKEIIYFDPIFAIKELEEFGDIDSYPFLRFRIQQIGLISQLSRFGQPEFHEVYAFDLEVSEVRMQNDRVYAEIIFAFDEVQFDKENADIPLDKKAKEKPRRFVEVTAETLRSDIVEEDPNVGAQDIHKLRTTISVSTEKPGPKPHPKEVAPKPAPYKLPDGQNFSRPRPISKVEPPSEVKPKPSAEPQAGKLKPTFGDFLNKVKKDVKADEALAAKDRRGEIIDIFKTSSNIQDFVEERGKKQVVLKLKSR